MILETIYFFGHENILCTHNTTLEITKDKEISTKGNCILGINASKGCADLNPRLKKLLKQKNKFKIMIKVGEFCDCFYGYGHPDLTLLDKNDIVFRKSNFICDRTILINCTKSSSEINRILIEKLKNENKKFFIEIKKVENNAK